MDIKTIGVEDWLNVWEKSATYDIAQSTIASLTMGEILALDGQEGATFYERLNREKMNYGWRWRSIPIASCRQTALRVRICWRSWHWWSRAIT